MEILEWLQQLGASVAAEQKESSLFFLYVMVCYLIKRPVFLLVFFICNVLINADFAQFIKEYQVYLIVLIMYSYLFNEYKSIYYRVSCGIIIFISLTFSIDGYFYGVGGYHGATETLIYNHLPSVSLYAHLLFISSLVYHGRIRHNLQCIVDFIERITFNSYNMRYILSFIKKRVSQ